MKKLIALTLAATAAVSVYAGDTKWYSADSLPLIGKAVDDACTSFRYQRVPDSIESKVKRYDVFWLGNHSAGMAVRFRSDSPEIKAKWKSRFKVEMNHMPTTGMRGLDLYTLLPDGTWTYVQTARPDFYKNNNANAIISNMEPEMREYMLNLSLYDGVDSLYIGIDGDYQLLPPAVDLPSTSRPIVMYGTSILQGGCASRPGMCHTNILSRRLNREIINLGFSGNGQLDMEIADIIAAVPDPGLVVLDFVPNVNEEQIDTLMIPFFETIRSAHPDVPFLFVEDPDFPHKRFDVKAREQVDTRNAMMKERYEKLAAKYPNLYYLPADDLMGHDHEATVDGIHYTDLGFIRVADVMEPIIRKILLPVKK